MRGCVTTHALCRGHCALARRQRGLALSLSLQPQKSPPTQRCNHPTRIPTKIDLELNFYVEPVLQAQWITDGLRLAGELPSVHAVGWIHLYDEPSECYGG